MLAQLSAILATVRTVVGIIVGIRFRTFAGIAVATASLVGCIPTGGTLIGADPADPTAKVAAVGY